MDARTSANRRNAPPARSTDRHRLRTGLLMLGISPVLAVLAGCAAGSKQNTLPTSGPTMAEIYERHMQSLGRRAPPPVPRPGAGDPAPGPATEATQPVNQRFTRLPNPDLVMYVAPHLSADGRYPIPGYSTVIPLYERIEYALPGELRPSDALPARAAGQ